MYLANGKQLHVFNWTEFPIDDYVINKVKEMSRYETQPIMTNGYPILE